MQRGLSADEFRGQFSSMARLYESEGLEVSIIEVYLSENNSHLNSQINQSVISPLASCRYLHYDSFSLKLLIAHRFIFWRFYEK